MKGLTYCDGYFPACIPSVDIYGEPYEVWDKTTYYQPFLFGPKVPSKSSTEYIPVVGPHTSYPIGLSLEDLSDMYWRVKEWGFTFEELERLTITADTITVDGGYYTFVDPVYTWNPVTRTVDDAVAIAEVPAGYPYKYKGDYQILMGSSFEDYPELPEPPMNRVCMPDNALTSLYGWKVLDSADTPLAFTQALFTNAAISHTVTLNDPDPSEDNHGANCTNEASVSLEMKTSFGLIGWAIYAAGKYWPSISASFAGSFLTISKRRYAIATRQDITPPTVVVETDIDESSGVSLCFYGGTLLMGGSTLQPLEYYLPCKLKLVNGKTIDFTIGTWGSPDLDWSLIPATLPVYVIEATGFFTYGGIYSSTTGLKI